VFEQEDGTLDKTFTQTQLPINRKITGTGKKLETEEMKTKLTFLLSLTFLFLFSGSVYGEEEVKKEDHNNGNLKSEGFKLFKENHICFPRVKFDEYSFTIESLNMGGFYLDSCPDCIVLSHTKFKKEDLIIDKGNTYKRYSKYKGNGAGMLLTKTKIIFLQYKQRSFSWWNYKQGFDKKWFVRNETNEVFVVQNESQNQRILHESFLFEKKKFDCYMYLGNLDKLKIDKWIDEEKKY
jgi:hypothetical protein